uniref:hypothetical protein n=1 Tax=Flavobacterium sp. TaxID=239 RepID=UPI00404ADE5C
MGLNISGLVIDKNYENNLTELESILGQKLVFEKEVIFEETLENWKEDTYCDIYFSKNGTFVLLAMEIGGFDFYAKNQTVFSFVLSEMTMVFTVNYTKDNKFIRSIMVADEMTEEEGEPFEFEKDEEDKSELIYHLIETTLGESFDDIDFEAKCFRYSFKKEQEQAQEKVQKQEKVKEPNKIMKDDNNESTREKIKPWWKFW